MAEAVSNEASYMFLEGVADEVVLVFIAGIAIVFTVLAWQSTHVRHQIHPEQEQSHVSSGPDATRSGSANAPASTLSSDDSSSQTPTDTTSPPTSRSGSTAPSSSESANTDTSGLSAPPCGCAPVVEDSEITVRIKYLDERVREVRCRPHLTVNEFKLEYFAEERAANMEPRLIFNGRELRAAERCLHFHGVSQSGATIHCLLRPQRDTADSTRTSNEADADSGELFDLGRFMMPVFGTFLIAIWYVRVAYRHYFTAISTCALLSISFLFVVACIVVYSNSQQADQPSAGSASGSTSRSSNARPSPQSANDSNLRYRATNIVS